LNLEIDAIFLMTGKFRGILKEEALACSAISWNYLGGIS
jgi:hypothetical protein